MDAEKAREYVRKHHRAVLGTRRSDGRVQMSPILVGIDADGRAMISSRERAFKVRNLRREPRATLCVINDDFFSDWIQIEGPTTILSLPEAMEPLVDYYRTVSGEHANWDEYREAMQSQRRVLIRVDIESAGPDRQA
ncbi:MAG TPA: PPOX class F420-dependent oxidoreductase [Acidimicrobiales bacterium]|jgi:PPOX class probable F420-dependent enzyme